MKRIGIIALVLILALSMAACRRGSTDNTEPSVTTQPTTTPTTAPTTQPTTMPTIIPEIDPTIDTNIPDPDVDTSMPDISEDFTGENGNNARGRNMSSR